MENALYMNDSYLKEFEAAVESVKDGKYVVLSQTAFYPLGGGVAYDTGILVKDGEEFPVVSVGKFEGKISHEVSKPGLKQGDKVTGKINWERRYKLMKLHTTAHLLAAIFHNKAGALITGGSIEPDKARMDFSLEDFDREKVDDDVLVVSGDNLFDFSLKEAQVFFMKKKAVVNALFDCKDIDAAKELGTVVVDSSSRFVEFFEKSPEPKTTLVSAGVYFFPKEKIRLMRQYVGEGNNADKIGYFLAWLLKKEPVFGYKYGGRWFDIGIRDVLDKAKKVF